MQSRSAISDRPSSPKSLRPVAFNLGSLMLLGCLNWPANAGEALVSPPLSLRGSFHDSEVSFGAAATTDYLFRGITQTDHQPAIQGYVEGSYGIAYAGAWASNVEFSGDDDAEFDVSLGLRPAIGDLSLDVGYVQYLYANGSVPTYGEIYGKAEYTFGRVTVAPSVYASPDYVQLGEPAIYLEANASVQLPQDITFSGAIGRQFFDHHLGLADYTAWNLGASWTYQDTLKFDLRYFDTDLDRVDCELNSGATNACDARIVATVSLDSSLASLSALTKDAR